LIHKKNIIVALDNTSLLEVENILNQLDPQECLVKVGSILFNSNGKEALALVSEKGFEIFLDLKFHDIPNTVKDSILSFIDYKIKFFTVHISGGPAMLQAAKQASKEIGSKCIGVSILTSLTSNEIIEIYSKNIQEVVSKMFILAGQEGLDGIVCSPLELEVAAALIPNLIKITPGIRMSQNRRDDQSRTLSAKQAILNGADYLVIGRPITKNKNIKQNFNMIHKSIYE